MQVSGLRSKRQKQKKLQPNPIALRRILIGTGRKPIPLRIAGERMMSESAVTAAGAETRQSMIRVWLAISAVWVAFWLLIAAVIGVAIQQGSPFEADINIFALIVLTPPLALLALGVSARLLFEALARRA